MNVNEFLRRVLFGLASAFSAVASLSVGEMDGKALAPVTLELAEAAAEAAAAFCWIDSAVSMVLSDISSRTDF